MGQHLILTQIYSNIQKSGTPKIRAGVTKSRWTRTTYSFSACRNSLGCVVVPSLCCTAGETISLGLSWRVLSWLMTNIHLLGSSSTSWKQTMLQSQFYSSESTPMPRVTYPFPSLCSAFRGNHSCSASHLGVQPTQLPGQLGSHTRQRGRLPGPVRASPRGLGAAAGGGWQAKQHRGGEPGTQHHLPGDGDGDLQVRKGEIPVS